MNRIIFLTISVLLSSTTILAQNRLILNNDAYVVIDDGAHLVIQNPNPNAISTLGTGGNILSEGEQDVIQWEVGSALGIFTIPWTTNSGTKIPLVINKTTAGSGASGNFLLSTWECATDMNVPWPSGITSMNFNGVDKSLFAADRYWHIDALSYAIKPNIVLDIHYDPAANEIGGANTILETNLQAQRFNTSLGHWEAYNLLGTNDAINNRVISIGVTGANFFEDWILVDNTNPLPVELSSFDASCQNENIAIRWQTSAELNNDYFILEKSYDAENFFELTRISGQGNSNVVSNYQFIDYDNSGTLIYYRLKQVNFNGVTTTFHQTFTNCENPGIQISNLQLLNGSLSFDVNSSISDYLSLILYDYTGKQVLIKKILVNPGQHYFSFSNLQLASSLYVLSVSGSSNIESFKLFNKSK